MSRHLIARQNPGQLIHAQELDDPRTDTEKLIQRTFAQEWLKLNTQLSVEDSYKCQDEMEQYDAYAEKLIVVRNWAGRMATAATWSKRMELLSKIVEIQAKIDEIDAKFERNDCRNNYTDFFYLELHTLDLEQARAELAALE